MAIVVISHQPTLENLSAQIQTCSCSSTVILTDPNAKTHIVNACTCLDFFKVKNHGFSMNFLENFKAEALKVCRKRTCWAPTPTLKLVLGISDTLWGLVREYVEAVKDMAEPGPGCHHRDLIPYHIVSLPLPPITATFAPSRISNYAAPAPAPSSFDYEYSDQSGSDDDDDYDYDDDNSLPSLTATDSYQSTPAAKSIVGSLRVKMISPNSTAQPLQSCSICMVDFDVDSRSCVIVNEHYFHKDCIVEWLQRNYKSCPLCQYKLPLDPNQLDDEYDAVSSLPREGGLILIRKEMVHPLIHLRMGIP